MATYSFLDVNASITGPGIGIDLGNGSSIAEEGITIEASEDINTMTVGADGSPMHSLHANKSGTITIRYLKTSPVNQKLGTAFTFQTSSGSFHGQNTIVVSNKWTNDSITCQQVAFKKAPTITYAKEGGILEWVFAAGSIDRALGSIAGAPFSSVMSTL